MIVSVTSGTSASYHLQLVDGDLPCQSFKSNFVSFEPRYNNEIAIISGSHCRHRFV